MDSLQEYTLRELNAHRVTKAMKALKVKNLKSVTVKSFQRYKEKARAVRGDRIQEKLLNSDAVVMDRDSGDFVVVEHSSSIDFIPVDTLQVSTIVMQPAPAKSPLEVKYGNAINCKQTLSTSVQLKN